MQLSLTKPEFMKQCTQCIENQHAVNWDIELVPILMFNQETPNANEFWIEYVWIVTIDDLEEISIGISFKYLPKEKSVKVSGIHLDREYLIDQHQLLLPNSDCHCFDAFKSNINYLSIGNPDDLLNKIKYYKQSIDNLSQYKEFINSLMNIAPNDIQRLQSLQKQIAEQTGNKLPAQINKKKQTALDIPMISMNASPNVQRLQLPQQPSAQQYSYTVPCGMYRNGTNNFQLNQVRTPPNPSNLSYAASHNNIYHQNYANNRSYHQNYRQYKQ